jgi:hypothetical protein
VWAASLQVGGYAKLILNLARQHGFKVHVIGQARYLNRDDLELLRQLVRNWLSRPRMSRPRKKSVARPRRSRKNSSSEVIGETAEP